MARHGQQQWSFDHGMPPDWPFDSHSIKIKTLCNKMIKGVKAVTSNLLSTYPKKKKMNGNFDYHIPGSDFKRITHILKYQHEAFGFKMSWPWPLIFPCKILTFTDRAALSLRAFHIWTYGDVVARLLFTECQSSFAGTFDTLIRPPALTIQV